MDTLKNLINYDTLKDKPEFKEWQRIIFINNENKEQLALLKGKTLNIVAIKGRSKKQLTSSLKRILKNKHLAIAAMKLPLRYSLDSINDLGEAMSLTMHKNAEVIWFGKPLKRKIPEIIVAYQ